MGEKWTKYERTKKLNERNKFKSKWTITIKLPKQLIRRIISL